MTPMQSLKNQFDLFKNLLPAVFEEVSLNKSEPSTHVHNFCGEHTEYRMKGVRSDFIKTFKAKFNDQDSYSIGFSFRYLGMTEAEQTLQVSLKVGNKEPLYFEGDHLCVKAFRTTLAGVSMKLQDLTDKNHKTVVDVITEGFDLKPSQRVILGGRSKMKKRI